MSEKKTVIEYDLTKTFNADINPAFISGLQQIYFRYITEFYEDVDQFGELIKSFNLSVQDPEKHKKSKRTFTTTESELYTLYALINLFKNFAHEQGLAKVSEVEVDKVKFDKIANDAKEQTKDPIKMLQIISEKLQSS